VVVHRHEGDDYQHRKVNPEVDHQHRRHFEIHSSSLLTALGLPGTVRQLWMEPNTEYVHIMVDDPGASALPAGGYTEGEHVGVRQTWNGEDMRTVSVEVAGTTLRTWRVPETVDC